MKITTVNTVGGITGQGSLPRPEYRNLVFSSTEQVYTS